MGQINCTIQLACHHNVISVAWICDVFLSMPVRERRWLYELVSRPRYGYIVNTVSYISYWPGIIFVLYRILHLQVIMIWNFRDWALFRIFIWKIRPVNGLSLISLVATDHLAQLRCIVLTFYMHKMTHEILIANHDIFVLLYSGFINSAKMQSWDPR